MGTHLELPPVVHTLVLSPALSDEEFEQLCVANGDVQLERTTEGTIVVNPPAAFFTGDSTSEIIYQLRAWWRQHRSGRAFDSNTGFFLPDGSMLSPDAAYVRPERLRSEPRGWSALRACVSEFRNRIALRKRSPTCRKTEDGQLDRQWR